MIIKTGGKLYICLLIMTYSVFAIATPNNENNSDTANIKFQLQELKNLNEAINSARNAVEAFADSSFLPELLFHLSELELMKAKLQFNLDMENFDDKLQLYEKDSTNYQLPQEPQLTYQPTIDINRRIMNEFPDVPFLDKVMYRTGMCLYEIGKRDSARILFLKSADLFSDSSYIAELHFRIGECYFDEQQFEQALEYYDKILGQVDSPFFMMALYKKAWCHYNLNDYPLAISTYFYLLKDIQFVEEVDTDILGKSQSELREEAIEYIATCFMDFGGLDRVIHFIKNLGGTEYAPQIMQKMAEFYFKRDFYEEAIKVNKYLLKSFPLYEYAPQVHFHLFECHNKLGDPDEALTARNDFVESFKPNSVWVTKFNSKERHTEIVGLIDTMDVIVATPYLMRADSLFSVEEFEQATEKYKKFLKTFPKDDRADHAAYFLAESLYELEKYRGAALAYLFVTSRFSESELREDAAYNRIVCYDNIEKNNAIIKNQKKVVLACRDFIEWFPASDKSIEIQIKLVETLMNLKHHKVAENLLKKVIIAIVKHNRGVQYYSKALNLIAQANFEQEDFQDAEKWYTFLIQQNPDSAELIERSKTMLASARFKVAEGHKEKGDANTAALKFEKTAWEVEDAKVAQAALFESALQFEKAGELKRAAVNFEAFCEKYPNSENIEQALYHAATIREKLYQWYLAAKNYLEIFQRRPNAPQGASALFNAGLNFENAKGWTAMAKTFNDFINYFPDDDKLLEAMFKIALAHEQNGNDFKARQMYQNIVAKYNRLVAEEKFADDFIAAQSQFRIGEMEHNKFSAIKIKPPFQQNLKIKQNAFNRMLQHLAEVAKYNVAEWTTAAFYKIGYGYEEFCQDILNSPAPANLSGDQLNEYWDTIHQQWILPLQAEALKYYKTNAKLAVENNLKNNWIEKTKDRILYLNKKLATFNKSVDSTLKKTINTVNDHTIKTKKRNM